MVEIKEYDEFGIFVTDIHIKRFIEKSIKSDKKNTDMLYELCIKEFGDYNKTLIKSVLLNSQL